MLVIADTSALLALAACDGLVLLDTLFADVRVPRAVFAECTVFYRIEVVGSIGVLLAARDRALIPRIAPRLAAIRRAGIFLSEPLVDEALRLAGER